MAIPMLVPGIAVVGGTTDGALALVLTAREGGDFLHIVDVGTDTLAGHDLDLTLLREPTVSGLQYGAIFLPVLDQSDLLRVELTTNPLDQLLSCLVHGKEGLGLEVDAIDEELLRIEVGTIDLGDLDVDLSMDLQDLNQRFLFAHPSVLVVETRLQLRVPDREIPILGLLDLFLSGVELPENDPIHHVGAFIHDVGDPETTGLGFLFGDEELGIACSHEPPEPYITGYSPFRVTFYPIIKSSRTET